MCIKFGIVRVGQFENYKVHNCMVTITFVYALKHLVADRPQVYGCCSVDQVSSHRDYRELLSLILF